MRQTAKLLHISQLALSDGM